MDKRLHPPLSKKRWPRNRENYRRIILTAIVIKVCYVMLLNSIQTQIENILRKT